MLHAQKFYAPHVSSILLLNTLYVVSSCICANKFFMKSLITNAIYHSVCVSVGWCSNRIIHTQMQIWCFFYSHWNIMWCKFELMHVRWYHYCHNPSITPYFSSSLVPVALNSFVIENFNQMTPHTTTVSAPEQIKKL